MRLHPFLRYGYRIARSACFLNSPCIHDRFLLLKIFIRIYIEISGENILLSIFAFVILKRDKL